MNLDEKRVLVEFLEQLKGIRGVSKDTEADLLIERAAVEQPDAVYLLVQKALIQDQAIRSARSQIVALQQELREAKATAVASSSGGFLAHDPWASPSNFSRPAAGYPPQGAPAASMAPPFIAGPAPTGSPFGGFLGSAAATAAGVAGGAFLFHGIESLMGHHGSGLGYSDTAFSGEHAPENVTINECYGDGYSPQASAPADPVNFGQNDFVTGDDDWGSYDDDSVDT